MAVDRKKLRRLCEAATPGPWERVDVHGIALGVGKTTDQGKTVRVFEMILNTLTKESKEKDTKRIAANADLIVAARNALLPLLNDLDAAEKRVVELEGIVKPLDRLRANEGASVTIVCPNPEFTDDGRDQGVDVTDEWTDWEPRRFYGVTLAKALEAAEAAKEKLDERG